MKQRNKNKSQARQSRFSFNGFFETKPKIAALLCAAIFALLGAFGIAALDVGHAPDVWTHTYRISAILNGDVVAHPVSSTSLYHCIAEENVGGRVSNDIVQLSIDNYNNHDTGVVDPASLASSATGTASTTDTTNTASTTGTTNSNTSDTSEVPFNNTAVYSPVAYIPQLLGFGLGSALGLPAVVQYYLAEIFMLLFWTVCCTAAIMIIPRYRLALFLVIVFPGMWFPSSFAISADSLALALSILFAALLYRCVLLRPSTRYVTALASVGFLLAIAKFAYAPLFVLALIVPFMHRKVKGSWIVFATFVAAVLIDLAWVRTNSWFSTSPAMVPFDAVQERTSSLFYNLPDAISQIAYSIVNVQGSYIFGREGVFVFWIGILLGAAAIIACIVKKIALRNSANNAPQNPQAQKPNEPQTGNANSPVLNNNKLIVFWCAVWIVLVTTALLVYLALWMQYTPADTAGVLGIQYRYFLPFLPYGVLLLVDCHHVFWHASNS
ncbi:DUF2142 domain-containing protein [Adlercreutzia sp. ZJ304]|uniref:DUF2142 domain-containing protein n=1 Tax=Adlercreutzia sp. ZJ304 TaxID=2709791 RepID=UPI0013EC5573|nr:DUF2142 domain-containing protein [Adlercreutzia sp. ZJ304]